MIDKRLVMLLDEKISMLQADGEDKNRKMEEIKHVKRIIKVLQSNPFNLYTLKPEELKAVVSILPEEVDFVEKVAKYRTIYEGCLQFGREAIPQVSLIEDYVRTTQATLEEKGHELTDKIASYQYTDAKLRKYSNLFEEINDEDSLITDTSTLIEAIKTLFGAHGLGNMLIFTHYQIFKLKTIIIFVLAAFACTPIFKSIFDKKNKLLNLKFFSLNHL